MPVNGLSSLTPALSAAGLLAKTKADGRKQLWPYPWEYPTEAAQAFNLETTVAAPANGTQTQLWSFAVPDGEFLSVKGIMLAYVGIPNVDGLGQISWQWDVNIPTVIGGGVGNLVLPSGYIVPYFGNLDVNGNPTGQITISKGSTQFGPWRVPGRLVFAPRDVVRIKVTTLAPFPDTGVWFLTSLVGWTWPAGN